MKRIVFVAVCIAAISAASCQKIDTQDGALQYEPSMVPASVKASIADTRVTLDGVSPKWEAGDRIALFTTDGTLCPAFTTQDSGSSATFSGTKPDGSTLSFAVYPYSAAVSASSGSFTVTVPAEQDGTIASAVMVAPAGDELMFSNLLSVIKFNVPSSLGVRRVEIISDGAVSGNFTVNGSTLAVTAPSSPTDAARKVAAVSTSGFSGDVLVSMIPSTSKRLQMVLTNASGKVALVSKDLGSAMSGGRIKNLGSVPSGLSFGDVALIGSSTSSQVSSSSSQPSKPQIKNGGFETWTIDGENLPNNWNSFQTFQTGGILASLLKSQGYDSNNRQVKRSTDIRPGSAGSYSCRIWSRSTWGVVAQGNLTTGRVYASNTSAAGEGNYNYTDQDGSTVVNKNVSTTPNPFHMDFTGKPDSMVVWMKFTQKGTDTKHPYGKVEAILHDKVDYKSGYNAKDCTGGTHHIGEASTKDLTATGSWKRLSLPFVYDDRSSAVSFVLINFTTNSYPGGGAVNDEMIIDDIEMVYNLYNIRTSSTGWATLYLDYDALIPSGATVYYVKNVACGYAGLVEIPAGQLIPARTAVLVKGNANTVYSFNGRETDIEGKSAAAVSGNLLKGTLTSMSRPGGICRVLSAESSTSMAAFGDFTGSTIAAHSAYLTQ